MKLTKEQIKNYDSHSFGNYIRNRREELGFSCRAFAIKMDMSAVYLSDIENGNRPAPLKVRNGKDYINDFIKHLIIPEEEIEFFYEMAAATRGISSDLQQYIKNNRHAQIALRLACEVNLSDEEWQAFISNILEAKKKKDER